MEPFFTTKTRTLSTGLGLALVHNIICRAGGAVEIDSELGRGTTFVLTIPLIPENSQPGETLQSAARKSPLATRKAVVTVADPRVSGIAQSLLRAMRFSIAAKTDIKDAQVWVVDLPGLESSIKELELFLQADSRRRVVVLGGNATTRGDHDQMSFVPDLTKVTVLREAFENATSPTFDSGPRSSDHDN